MRIGTAHLDRLLSYPDVRNLSGCLLPIRVRCPVPELAGVPVLRNGLVQVLVGARDGGDVCSRGVQVLGAGLLRSLLVDRNRASG